MVDLAKWCLSILYFYGRATGVINYEIDFKKCRTKVTKRATISAACLNFGVFILLAYHFRRFNFSPSVWKNTNSLQDYVFVILSVLQTTCVLLTLVSRWTRRKSFMRLINSFMCFYNPDIIPYCRRSIVSKFFCISISQTLHIILVLYTAGKHIILSLDMCAILSQIAIVNVIIMHYFFAFASLRARYILLNKDLNGIMDEILSLNPKRRGVFITSCCNLADRLEKLAQSQSDLQALIERFTRTDQGQVVCLIINFYLNFLGRFYLLFILSKCKILSDSYIAVLAPVYIAFIIVECLNFLISAYNIFHLLDAHEDLVKTLSQRTTFRPCLDPRLEAVIDSFALNLARNPLELRFLGLFKINRFGLFALFNSLLAHTITLIQYDIEKF